MKKLIILLIITSGIGLYCPVVRGEFKSFDRGDSIYFDEKIIVAAVVSGDFEIFSYGDDKFERKMLIGQNNAGLFTDEFVDVVLRVEENKLFAYLAGSRHFYKYDLTNINRIKLVLEKKLNLKTKIISIDKNNKIIYSSEQGKVRILDENLNELTSYNFSLDAGSFTVANSEDIIFGIEDSSMFIYSMNSRKMISRTSIEIKNQANRSIYLSEESNEAYLIDDENLNIVDFNGAISSKLKHLSVVGYDTYGIDNYIYFSDGIGIVKVDKQNMKAVNWLHTETIVNGNGWAMGLNYIEEVEKLVVFNNSEILLLDKDLGLVATMEMERKLEVDISKFEAKVSDNKKESDSSDTFSEIKRGEKKSVNDNSIESEVIVSEKTIKQTPEIFLHTNVVVSGEYIDINGSGFLKGDEVSVEFLDEKRSAVVTDLGEFLAVMQVPPALPGNYEIKVSSLRLDKTFAKKINIE